MNIIDPVAYGNSQFGLVSGPIVWSNVFCEHWNKDIFHCTKTTYSDFSCDSYNVARVRCTEGECTLVSKYWFQ